MFLWSLAGPGSTGYAGYVAPRTLPPWLSAGAALVVDMVTAGFACVDAFALFPPFCRQAQDARHLVTMDSFSLVVDSGSLCTRLVLLVRCIMRCVPFCGAEDCGDSAGAVLRCGDVVPALVHDWVMIQTALKSGCVAEEGLLLRALHIRCRAGGRNHRDMAPRIRCMRWRFSTKTFVIHLVRTTTTTTRRFTQELPFCVARFCETSTVDMSLRVDGTGPAKRRGGDTRRRASRQRWSQLRITTVMWGPQSTKPHGDRRRPPRRRQGSRRTLAYGHRCPCLRGRGRSLLKSRCTGSSWSGGYLPG